MVKPMSHLVQPASKGPRAFPMEEELVNEVLHELPSHVAERHERGDPGERRLPSHQGIAHCSDRHWNPKNKRRGRMYLREKLEEVTLKHSAALVPDVVRHTVALGLPELAGDTQHFHCPKATAHAERTLTSIHFINRHDSVWQLPLAPLKSINAHRHRAAEPQRFSYLWPPLQRLGAVQEKWKV